MAAVATALLGEPNKALSTKDRLRYGNHGSVEINLAKGAFFDFEEEIGGGVLDLIKRIKGLEGGDALDWMREIGCPLDEPNGHAHDTSAPRRIVAAYDYVDESGDLIFQVVRMEPKTFRQRRRARPDDDPKKVDAEGWVWSV